jgi:peptidoglycan hydrolase-like protein with peptidoglycan-binding domain
MVQAIKEKIQSAVSSFGAWGASERMALVVTILSGVLLLLVFVVIINFILPKTGVGISISHPEKAKAGEEVTYTVTVKNTGTVILKKPELVFNYPTFSLPETALYEREQLEDLYPEQEKTFTFKARLFGMEGEERSFEVWLNYSKEGQTKITRSESAHFSTVISEVPIDLVLDIPEKAPVHSKDKSEFVFRIRYFSSIEQPVPNLKLSVDFPPDFNFQESIPSMAEGQEITIGTLEPSTVGGVEITGNLPAGYDIGKELEFSAQLSINLEGTDVPLKKESAKTITYEPVFSFSQKINNQEKYFPYAGEKLYYEIYFKNVQDEPLRDLSLTTVLEGPLFDLETIEAPLGTFTKGANSISWDGGRIPELRYLTPDQEGKVELWVTLKDDYKPKDISEANALISNRVILGGFEREFRSRVNSLVKITQEGYFRDKYGFFENSGPQPPRVAETTQYTIVWKLENYYNWLEDTVIKASLPSGASIRSFKPAQGEITVLTYPTPVINPYPDIPTTFRFEKSLYEGVKGIEVTYLQLILKAEVPRLYPAYVPATGYFGPTTREALKGFQEKYKKEILELQGLPASGQADELTRLKLNELLAKVTPPAFAEITWEVGKVKPGIGTLEDPLTAAFQIAFTPEMAQKGKVAPLINEVRISAKDQWTELSLSTNGEAVDTTLPHDPTVKNGTIR